MNGKMKRIKDQIKKAQKKLVKIEAWEFWQENLEKARTYPQLKCSNCNTILEDSDYIPNPEIGYNSCNFCGTLV